jgi:very-short-patch-repair endonuclease
MEQDEQTKEFIRKAMEVHGDTYDYSKVEYKKAIEKVIIICKTHGDFLQTPNGHLCGSGCIKCVNRIKRRSNIEEFIIKATDVHVDKYDYSKFNYVNCKTKGIIICKEHGEFTQHASNHLLGKGCSKCAGCYKYTTNEFIEKSKEIHGDIYDYSKFNYIDSKTPGIIICKAHGEFLQSPVNHYASNGCINCIDRGKALRYDTLQFIEKAKEIHGDTYDYSQVNYISSQSKVIIICKIHGEFLQGPANHLQMMGCLKCSGRYQPTTEEFIERANELHGDKYDYSKVIYKTAKEKIIIICKIHGDFEQIPDCHLRGNGCPLCVNKTEAKLYEKLLPIYPSLLTQFKQDWCKKKLCLPYDFCIPELKIIIELDGAQHFKQVANWKSPEHQFENDKYKEECANQNGYSVIRLLQEDVFYDTYDWVKELCDTIEELKSSEGITNIYLCKNDEYELF